MPVIIRDNEQRSTIGFRNISYDYDYPERMNLKPGNKLHDTIVNKVLDRARESYNVMSSRHPAWKKIDETLTAYIKADDKEKIVQNKDERKPISIVIPQSYATMEILLTYMSAALLDEPLFRFEGRSPEDILGSILLEKVVEQQITYSKIPLSLHTVFRDGFAYGFGAASPCWTTEYGWVTQRIEKPTLASTLGFGQPKVETNYSRELIYEGNRVDNIDPYLFLPDPSVPINRINDGEYCGWVSVDNLMGLLKEEESGEYLFNVRYLKHLGDCRSQYAKNDSSGRATRTGVQTTEIRPSVSTRVDVVWMYVDLIASEWGLKGGRSKDYPETWLFGVAGDNILICAQPMKLNHNRKPVLTFAPEFDGYSIAPISKIEIVNGLQTVLDFLFNSHISNVRKAVNDMLIVDPSMIDIRDFEDPQGGLLVKMRRSMWGRGVENAVKQLKVEDITRANVADANVVVELMKAISGSVDSLSGVRRKTSERVTAEEIRGDRTGGLSRLEKMAKIAGWMFMQDLGYMLASHTQQFMSKETFIRVTGQWSDVLREEYGAVNSRMVVSPTDLNVTYDVIPKDGSIPGGNFSDAWVQLLPQLSQHPELMQKFDLTKVVKHILRSMGAKDVNQFDRQVQPQVMPDQMVSQELQAGNIVPMEGGDGYTS